MLRVSRPKNTTTMLRTLIFACIFSIASISSLQSQISVVFTGGTAQPGETIDIDVSVSDFTEIVSFQFSINWDPTVLTYNSIQNVTTALEEFSEEGNIGTPPGAVAISEGQLTVSWNLASTDPRSLDDNTRLFTFRLNSIGSACDQTDILLSDMPRRIEVADENFVDIGAAATNSVVDIMGTDCQDGGGDNGGGDNGGGDNGGGDNGGGNTATFPDCDTSCAGATGVVLAPDCIGAELNANICVPVRASNFSNIASVQTGVTWDSTALSFTGINQVGITGITLNENSASSGILRVLWIIGFSDDPVTLDDNSVLFELCYDVLAADGESAAVMLESLNNFNIEVATGAGTTLDVCSQVGRVNVGEAGGGDNGGGDNGGGDNGGGDNGGGDNGGGDNGGGDNGGDGGSGGTENMCADSDDTSLIVQGGTVAANGNICVPITNMNFTEIASLQTGMQWDSNVLTFTEINERTLTGITLNENDASNGSLRILWLIPFGGDNISPPDGSVLFEICFDGSGADGQTSTLEFVDLPNFNVEVANGAGVSEQLCISQGQVTIGEDDGGGNNGGGNNGGGTNMGTSDGTNLCSTSSDISFILSDFDTDVNQNICVPVTTRNFVDIASIQTGITWNSSVLTYTGLNEEGITSISLNESDTADGELKILWLIGLGDDPVTLDDDATLFEICFDVTGVNAESSSINMESLPGFAVEVSSGSGIPQSICTDNGFVQIGGDVMPPDSTLILNSSNISNAEPGQESCIDISVSNFVDVQSAQFNVQWDSTFMTFSEFQDPGVLTNLGQNNFNLTSGENLRFSWSPVSPQQIANNSTIITLCFDVIGDCDATASSPVTFVNTPVIGIEFTNSSNELIPVTVQSGTVAIDCGDGKGELGPGDISAPMCADDAGGSILISAPRGFIAPVTCTWTREDGSVIKSSTEDCNLVSVPSGTYTLTATDAMGDASTRVYEISRLSAPDISFSTVDATCTVGGSINTTITGDFGPYVFSWTGGLPATEDQSDLDAATYQVTITDRNNCTYVRTVPLGGAIGSDNPLTIELVNLQNGSCDGGSRIEINPTGGCSPYTYLWTGPNGESSTEPDIFRVAPGDWTVVVTDENNNTATETYTLTSGVPDIQITESSIIRPTCDALNSGSIFVDVSGGCSSYIYEWNGPNGFRSTQEDISNLEAGEYTLDVTDNNDAGIFATRRITLTLEGNVDFTSQVENATNLDGNNGSITIDIPGGLDTLSFAWSDGSTELSRDSLAAGEYTLTISDGTDCPSIFFTEVQWAAIFLDEVIVQNPVSCIGMEDAVIGGEVLGGCEERIVRVNGVETTFPLMNLAPGTYEITADDACGTMVSKTIVVEDYVSFTAEANITCESSDADSGVVTLVTTGGSDNFSVEWSAGTVDPNDQRIVTGLSGGTYTAIISDGCEEMEVSPINVPDCGNGPIIDGTVCLGTPIITPNGDNLNETLTFTCITAGAMTPNNLSIYDRWGRLIFEENNYQNSWAGVDSDGQPLPEGGYMWVLVEGTGQTRVIHRGTVTVLKSGN